MTQGRNYNSMSDFPIQSDLAHILLPYDYMSPNNICTPNSQSQRSRCVLSTPPNEYATDLSFGIMNPIENSQPETNQNSKRQLRSSHNPMENTYLKRKNTEN